MYNVATFCWKILQTLLEFWVGKEWVTALAWEENSSYRSILEKLVLIVVQLKFSAQNKEEKVINLQPYSWQEVFKKK